MKSLLGQRTSRPGHTSSVNSPVLCPDTTNCFGMTASYNFRESERLVKSKCCLETPHAIPAQIEISDVQRHQGEKWSPCSIGGNSLRVAPAQDKARPENDHFWFLLWTEQGQRMGKVTIFSAGKKFDCWVFVLSVFSLLVLIWLYFPSLSFLISGHKEIP